MAYEFLDDNIALMRMLGECQTIQVISDTAAHTSKDFYCIYCVTETVVSSITCDSEVTNAAGLQTTLPAGTLLMLNITAITLTSGVVIGYNR
tara:strand:- start:12185 stop:12460 length:276 start_codon:yes stop_codon:yes gene_type:complete